MVETSASDLLTVGVYGVDHIPFAERCAAAEAAGFGAISLWFSEVNELGAAHGRGYVGETLAKHGLAPDHLELVSLPGPADPAERLARNRAHVDMAAELGIRAVHAVALDPGAPLSLVTETYRELVEYAADQGVLCAIEFVPVVTATPDLASVLQVFEGVDHPNGKLVMDSFHFFRSGADWARLEALPADSIATVQLNDGPIPPSEDFRSEVRNTRLLPGDGDFDLLRFMRAVDRARLPAPLAIEVASDAMRAMGASCMTAMAEAGRRLQAQVSAARGEA